MGEVNPATVGEQVEDAANVVADATEVPETQDGAPAPAIVIEPEAAPE